MVPVVVVAGAVSLGLIGWKAYRVDQSVRRARERSQYHFPLLVYDNTKRDAHRHILWSMMMTRYVGAFVAKQITDYHERDSFGPAKVMDLHNNDIGRSYRYSRFRNHWFWDRWDWREWARRSADYVTNEADNGVFIPEWDSDTTTTEEAWSREASVPVTRYIYFAQ